MVSCARAIRQELGGLAPPSPGEGLFYELDPSFSSIDEALDVVPPSLVARNIVANLDRPLTAHQITAGLRGLGTDISYEEVLQALSYLEHIRVVRKKG